MMAYHHIIIITILPSVLSYYFYNPLTNQILSRPSPNDVPDGYKLLPAPKNHKRNNIGKLQGNCTDAGFSCTTPYPRAQTYQFECDYDSQCPYTYKCCPQKCFEHNICTKSSSAQPPNGNNRNERPGTCEKWPYNCSAPYAYSLTSAFRCTSDRVCPKGFKCCEQNCFLHKICSRAIETPPRENYPTRKPSKTTKTTQETEPEDEDDENDDHLKITETSDTTEEVTTDTTEEVTSDITEEVTSATTEEYLESSSSSTTLQDGQHEEHSTTILTSQSSIIPESTVDYIVLSSTKSSFLPTIHDSNAIVPEYEEYYYHYSDGNNTEIDDEDYEDDDEEE